MTNERLKFPHIIFLDRTHGKKMSALLRRVGFEVQHIFEVYHGTQHEDISDPEWIKLCGQNGWIAVSGDKRLESVPANRQAVIDAKAKVFVLTDSNSIPEIWGAAIIVGHYKMAEIIDGNDGPFYVSVGKRANDHILRPKLPSGYSAPVRESDASTSMDVPPLQLTAPNMKEST